VAPSTCGQRYSLLLLERYVLLNLYLGGCGLAHTLAHSRTHSGQALPRGHSPAQVKVTQSSARSMPLYYAKKVTSTYAALCTEQIRGKPAVALSLFADDWVLGGSQPCPYPCPWFCTAGGGNGAGVAASEAELRCGLRREEREAVLPSLGFPHNRDARAGGESRCCHP